jgi:hypothetical protein
VFLQTLAEIWILLFFTIFGFWVDPAPGLADIKIAPERFSLTNT